MAYAKSSPPPRVHPIIQLMTREWRDAKDDERDPDWSVMSDAHIKESCEEVAAANPTWHKDLFAVYLDPYIAGLAQKKRWWVLPGAKSSAVQAGEDGVCRCLIRFILIMMLFLVTMAAPISASASSNRPATSTPSDRPAPPDPATSASLESALPLASTPTGQVTRATKGKAVVRVVEAPPVTVINPVAGSSNAPYGLRSRASQSTALEPPTDELHNSSDDDAPMKATELPRVQVQEASPPKPKLPFSMGNVSSYSS
jgi:hypothetical protein